MELARLWREHLEAGCPSELQGVDIAGSDALVLDAEVTACISAVMTRSSHVDDRIARRLEEIQAALQATLPLAEEPVAGYCERLNRLVSAALMRTRTTDRPS